MKTGIDQPLKLVNRFGMELIINQRVNSYALLYQGQNWLGKGMISVLYQKAWYRSLISCEKTADDLIMTQAACTKNQIDDLGGHAKVILTWQIKDTDISFDTSIKLYDDQPGVVFSVQYPNIDEALSIVFPQFAGGGSDLVRDDLHAWVPGFMGYYAIKHQTKASAAFADPDRADTAIPLVLYDNDRNTLILSPFSNYLVANQYTEKIGGGGLGYGFGGNKLICCGLNKHFQIPKGFRHETIIFCGHGINKTANDYGEALLIQSKKAKPDKYQDRTISYLSYWVDYGSYYWQTFFAQKIVGDYEETMVQLARDAEQNGLIIKSWEVQDGDQNRWPEGLFELREDIMPHGMSVLHQRIGQPLYAYISPMEPGPYRKQYPYVFTGHVAYGDIGSVGMGDLFYTDEFWDDQVRKCREWGCEGLMHDFLSNYWNTPAAVDTIDRYMKSMAKACLKYGLSIQYCMCFSNHVLETVENPAVISLQAIADHHPTAVDGGCGSNLRSFIYSSLLYGALGLWPARDNIQTLNDADAYEDVLVANLSGGPIQLGHEIGKADVGLLRQTFREGDGLLLKPDRPLCPIDACFIDDRYLIACTESQHESGIWHYVLSLNSGNEKWQGGSFSPAACGCDQDEYILYNYRTGETRRIDRTEIFHCPDAVKCSYYILAPLLGEVGTLIGDINKFITMADQRISGVRSDGRQLSFSLLAGGTAAIQLAGYSEKKPLRIVVDDRALPEAVVPVGTVEAADIWQWDASTGVWQIALPGPATEGVQTSQVSLFWA